MTNKVYFAEDYFQDLLKKKALKNYVSLYEEGKKQADEAFNLLVKPSPRKTNNFTTLNTSRSTQVIKETIEEKTLGLI